MKIYEYEGKIYSDEDISEKCSKYEGDLNDLLQAMIRNGDLQECIFYWSPDLAEMYEDEDKAVEEMILYGCGEEVTLESILDIETEKEVTE